LEVAPLQGPGGTPIVGARRRDCTTRYLACVDLEIGQLEGDRWRARGSFSGRVSKTALDRWAAEHGVPAGTYEVREPGSARVRYLFRLGPDGGVETLETLDLD
jgi:hypothetical protein